MTQLSGWGRYPIVEGKLSTPFSCRDVLAEIRAADGLVARGNGRAYGDAAIGNASTLSMLELDRMIRFDPTTCLLTVEAGVLLADVIAIFLPRGFFPHVVPGTRYVTIGGAIASDVHGKNHHKEGGFGDHVIGLTLVTGGGDVIFASREENSDLFFATIGGMGLTGTIVEATLRLRPVQTGWIRQTTVVANDLVSAIAALDASAEATYSVAWIDCVAKGAQLGRSLVFMGEHAETTELDEQQATVPFPRPADPKLSVPMDFPNFVLNRMSVAAFNQAYFRTGARKAGAAFLIPAGPYFFPLDGIAAWNRIYGRRGFVQHQCVLPSKTGAAALAELLERVVQRGDASFLAVLKKLGRSHGLIAFPMEGYTLALDFPLTSGLLSFLDELDEVVMKAGGRLYLAKDARQSRKTVDAGYPRADTFRALRQKVDPSCRIQSRLSSRLGL